MGMDMYLLAQQHYKDKECDNYPCKNEEKLIIHQTCRSESDRVPWYVCDKCWNKRISDEFYE